MFPGVDGVRGEVTKGEARGRFRDELGPLHRRPAEHGRAIFVLSRKAAGDRLAKRAAREEEEEEREEAGEASRPRSFRMATALSARCRRCAFSANSIAKRSRSGTSGICN